MNPVTKKLLIAVLVAQGLILSNQWFKEPAAMARNELNLPDPGARQLQMVDELKALNAKVDRLQATLSGELKVKVVKDKEDK